MRGAVLHGPKDLRFEERETPAITKPTDAILRISATCVCGSDLWPYRVIQYVVRKWAEKTKLDDLAPHDLRRTCAKLCHTAGGEIEQIQFLLGHASLLTTERYLGCKQNLEEARCAERGQPGRFRTSIRPVNSCLRGHLTLAAENPTIQSMLR